MKGSEVLRIVDQMHHEKDIDREVIFEGIQQALQLAAEKKYGEESGVVVTIDRDTGDIQAHHGEDAIEPAELGRIAAQSAKQVMIQKIREAESNQVFAQYAQMKGTMVTGAITRHEGGATIVSIGKTEAILPRGEQIPGETHHVGERIKAVVIDVKKVGHRVKVILSRTHPEFVRCLFENEIPEIADRTIEIRAIAREAGYRAKIAVSSIDLKVDCVGACVGVRGSRIKNVVEELNGERIDIVRWNDSLQVMIPNALQPATIDDVFIYPRLGRAIVLVKEDQLSLAIGRRGQNVRLGSKLVGWDIEIMTIEELNEGIEKAVVWFSELPYASEDTAERLIEEGFLSYDDLTFIEPSEMAELMSIDEDQAQDVIDYAEDASARVEEEARNAPPPAEEPAPEAATEPGAEGSETEPSDTETPAEAESSESESTAPEADDSDSRSRATSETPSGEDAAAETSEADASPEETSASIGGQPQDSSNGDENSTEPELTPAAVVEGAEEGETPPGSHPPREG